MLNSIPKFYRQPDRGKLLGILLAILSIMTGILLVAVSAWFITATALAGMGLISLQSFNLFLPSAGIRFLAIAKPLTRHTERLCTHRITLQIISSSRVWIFDKIFHFKKEDLVQFRNAELLNSLISDVDKMDHFYLGIIIPWLSVGITYLLAGLFFWFALPSLSWLLAATFIIGGLFIPWQAYKSGTFYEAQGTALEGRLHTDLISLLMGFADLSVFGLLKKHAGSVIQHTESREKIRRQSNIRLAGWVMLQHLVLQISLLAAVLIIYGHRNKLNGPLMVLIVLSLIILFETLQPLTAFGHRLPETVSAGSRINQLTGNGIMDSKEGSDIPFPVIHSLAFRNVSFSYGSRDIFKHTNCSFPAGTITVITGSNGMGKSTLLDLLCGLKIPKSGKVMIGDTPLTMIDPGELIEKIGYMEQQAVLFHTSVYENIALAKAGATEREIREAACSAGLRFNAKQSPGFLETDVGESGKYMSGGEAKMISLARIILKDAPILLMDEPTEGLDEQAEKQLIEWLVSRKNQKTIILVSHKNSILSIADYHLVLDGIKC